MADTLLMVLYTHTHTHLHPSSTPPQPGSNRTHNTHPPFSEMSPLLLPLACHSTCSTDRRGSGNKSWRRQRCSSLTDWKHLSDKKVTKYVYLNISILCYLTLHYISEGNAVLFFFTPLQFLTDKATFQTKIVSKKMIWALFKSETSCS